ncbi:MAG: sensor histidine kinase, partial [Ramlibacter sp.]
GAEGAPAVPAVPRPPTARNDDDANDDDEDDAKTRITRNVFTFRGLVGDLGATLIIVLFAYLAASKIVVRKVALADAKVRTAEDAAGREAMERQLVQARLQVLQAQVEPHFLFNTLAAVDYLIETDAARASQMQKALITYLRGALPQMRQESSTLGREMRLVRSYLELIKMRIEDRLDLQYEVPAELETAEFPPMMLQSLVENAIKHGIEPKPEGGRVTVAARTQKGQLVVEVRDTGVGVIDLDRLEAPTSGTGIGLQNIRERLGMLYGGKAHLSLMSDSGTGTTVRIAVPYRVPQAQAGGEGRQPSTEKAA